MFCSVLIHGHTARWCPMVLPLTGEFSGLGLAMESWAELVGVHRLFHCLPYLGDFHSPSFPCHWLSFMCFLQTSARPFLLHPLGEFPGVLSQRLSRGTCGAEISI